MAELLPHDVRLVAAQVAESTLQINEASAQRAQRRHLPIKPCTECRNVLANTFPASNCRRTSCTTPCHMATVLRPPLVVRVLAAATSSMSFIGSVSDRPLSYALTGDAHNNRRQHEPAVRLWWTHPRHTGQGSCVLTAAYIIRSADSTDKFRTKLSQMERIEQNIDSNSTSPSAVAYCHGDKSSYMT